jgi:Tfp pilus assembly protein PilN
MDGWDWLGLLAMLMLFAILAVLLMQYLQLGKIGALLEQGQAVMRERQHPISQQAELHSALRAEKAHVQQLLRKVEILQSLLPAA